MGDAGGEAESDEVGEVESVEAARSVEAHELGIGDP